MLSLAFPASADDDVLLKVHVRCRSCLLEAFRLAPVNRPPVGISAKAIFRRQKMFERMSFRCEGCDHFVSDLVKIEYPTADDVVDRSSPFPHLRAMWLARVAAAQGEDR